MILFLVVNNTQLFNAINLKMTTFKEEAADLCLCGSWSQNSMYDKLIGIHIFNNVFIYEDNYDGDQSIKGKIRKAISYLSSEKRLRDKLSFLSTNYDMVLLSGPSMTSIEVYYYLKKRCDLKLCIFEEGIFEYYMYLYKKNTVRRIYSRLVFGFYYMDNCSDVYVYDKSLLLEAPQSVVIHNIPKKFSDELINVMNRVFDFGGDNIEDFIQCQYLYMEQEFPTKEENERQKKIICELYSKLGSKLLIKLHPRSDEKKYSDVGINVIKTKSSMELIELNLRINPKIVFSINSSAVFNFISIFGCTSKVVFLYKMFDSVTIDEAFELYVEAFKNKQGKNTVHIPNNAQELMNCIGGDVNASST